MLLDLKCLSSRYMIKQFTKEDVSSIYELCIENPIYYEYMKSVPTFENIKDTLTELPPNISLDKKYFVGYYENNQLIALLDIITGYPNEQIVYIGWFMMRKELQGTGIGSTIIEEALSYFKEKKFQAVQLGYVKGNKQSEGFWRKNKFYPIGREKDTNDYTVVVMQREIGKEEKV
jgi:RimJ/RimL family protein N-acetyltransferase